MDTHTCMYDCVLPLNQHFFVLKLCLFSPTSAQLLLSVPFVIFTETAIKSNCLRCDILLHLIAAPLV